MITYIFIAIYLIVAFCYLLHYRVRRDPVYLMRKLIANYFLILVCFGALVAFIAHAFYPAWTSKLIGWPQSPFQVEIALANLAIGVGAFIGFFANRSYQWGVLTAYFVFYVGAGINHIVEIVKVGNMSPGNAGLILYTDLIMPVVLLILLAFARKVERRASLK